MHSWIFVFPPLLAVLSYIFLLIPALRQGTRSRLRGFFVFFLLTMATWSFGSLMMRLDPSHIRFWNKVTVGGGTATMPLALFGFVQAFLGQRRVRWLQGGFIVAVVLAIATAMGYMVEDVYLTSDGQLQFSFGQALPLYGSYWVLYVGYACWSLIQAYRRTVDPVMRNRIRYPLTGMVFVFVGGFTNAVPALGAFPIDHTANLITTCLLAYAIFRHQLLDITLVVRKGLLYSIPTVIIGAAYFLVISFATRLFDALAGPQIFLLSFIVAVMTAAVAQPLRDRAQHWIDRLFFREKYDSSLMLQRLSSAAAVVLDLHMLTGMILDEVTTTLHIKRAIFFLKQAESGLFHLMAQRGLDPGTDLELRQDHPIVDWLSNHENALTRRDVDVMPQFKALWGQEREDLERMEAELFIPLRAKGDLIGIFTVGQKLSEESYSQDDQLTLTTLANQTAVAIENARLYSELELRVQERTAELAKVNEALQAEISERRRAEEQIKASLKEKEVLLKEIHHRVKNNLQTISSLLRLQSGYTKDEQVFKMLEESRNRVHSMAAIHEILYQSKDLARVDFAEYTQKLAKHLLRSYNIAPQTVTLKINMAQVSLGIDAAISCGLIVNELVSNALKHAFPADRTGEICIDLYSDNGNQLTLTVSDNGVGFPSDVELHQVETLGLQLVTLLTEQLEGTIKLDQSNGTAFQIVFGQ